MLTGDQASQPAYALLDHLLVGAGEADTEGIGAGTVGEEGLTGHANSVRLRIETKK